MDFDSAWSGYLNQAEYISKRAEFQYCVEQRNFDLAVPFFRLRYGNAVLSRYPIEGAHRTVFPGYSAWETVLAGKKHGLLCTIKLDDTRSIQLLAVHLEHRSESVRLQSALEIETVRETTVLPLIAAGDFNSTPVSFPGATPDHTGQTAMSWLLDSGMYQTLPTSEPTKKDFTFSSTKPAKVIDWVLVPVDWKMVSRSVIDSQLSDHRAVVMEVETSSQTGTE